MLSLKKTSVKRQRGVVLSDQGLAKLEEAKHRSQHIENNGETYTAEILGERTGLDPHTLSKVFNRNIGVDKRTLQLCFQAFNLTLEADDYQRPQFQKGKVGTQVNKRNLLRISKAMPLYDDWGEAPDITYFYGRTAELAQLKQWLLSKSCRLVMLSGQAGVGKTFLAGKLVQQIHSKFDLVIWRSLDSIPPIREFLAELIQAFPNQSQDELPNTIQGKFSNLMLCLRKIRCLLVLDGAEQVLQTHSLHEHAEPICPASTIRKIPDFEWYRRLLKRIGFVSHESCVIVTTRQEHPEIKHFVGEDLPRRSLQLKGLTVEQGQVLCQARGIFQATQTDWENLIKYYGGHPLFLKIATTTIQKFFNGNITDFLRYNIKLYGDILHLLDRQFQDLSAIEQQLLCHLAQQSDPITFRNLCDQVPIIMSLQVLLETLERLEGRSLIEKKENYFEMEPVIQDYAIASCKAINSSGQI